MSLKTIFLTNFRNYSDFSLDFVPLTILVGPNGIGKTNLLEAVYTLATFSSYRTRHYQDLVKRGKDYARLVAQTESDTLELMIDLKTERKKIRLNQLEKRSLETLGTLIVVLFAPESLEIITGPPQARRRWMNLILSQIDQDYARALISLHQVLAQRNHLLMRLKQGLARREELDFWDQELGQLNKEIVRARQELIADIQEKLSSYYQLISNSADFLQIKYLIKAEPEELANLLLNHRDQEIEQLATLYGPHRDEIIFYLNGQIANAGWSRGEIRSAILALKMSELDFLTKKKNQKVILLLDDIFSELDKNRRKQLLSLVKNQQTIITTTDKDHLSAEILKEAKAVELN